MANHDMRPKPMRMQGIGTGQQICSRCNLEVWPPGATKQAGGQRWFTTLPINEIPCDPRFVPSPPDWFDQAAVSITLYDVDAYLTDHGWVARVTQLSRFGEDEVVYKADLGFQDKTEDAALRRGVRWVLSRDGRVRVVMRSGAPVPSAPYFQRGLP